MAKAKVEKNRPSPRSPPASGRGGKKLKVFRTPIGFHDAYVAAPSQKAALEAWGADSNLFARGEAEVVEAGSGPGAKEALERPGAVIRVLRGSAAEQVKALGKAPAKVEGKKGPSTSSGRTRREKDEGGSRIRSGMTKKKPKPSRAAVDRTEAALAKVEEKHRSARDKLLREEERLRERRRALEREQGAERRRLEEAAEAARDAYRSAMADWDEN